MKLVVINTKILHVCSIYLTVTCTYTNCAILNMLKFEGNIGWKSSLCKKYLIFINNIKWSYCALYTLQCVKITLISIEWFSSYDVKREAWQRVFSIAQTMLEKSVRTLSRPNVKSSPFPPWSMLSRPTCQTSARGLATLIGGGRGGVYWRGAFRLADANWYFHMTLKMRTIG